MMRWKLGNTEIEIFRQIPSEFEGRAREKPVWRDKKMADGKQE